MEFSRQEYWSGLQFPSSGDLFKPKDWPCFSGIAGRFFTTELPGKPSFLYSLTLEKSTTDGHLLWEPGLKYSSVIYYLGSCYQGAVTFLPSSLNQEGWTTAFPRTLPRINHVQINDSTVFARFLSWWFLSQAILVIQVDIYSSITRTMQFIFFQIDSVHNLTFHMKWLVISCHILNQPAPQSVVHPFSHWMSVKLL